MHGYYSEGEQIILGFADATTKKTEAAKGLLDDLCSQGLDHTNGLLCVIDGAEGLHEAIKETFGAYAQVQWCTWHKQEDAVRHIDKEEDKVRVRHKMEEAYSKDTYEEAKGLLKALHEELKPHYQEAANSLADGIEATLTLHRLGLARELGSLLLTTAVLENVYRLMDEAMGQYDP